MKKFILKKLFDIRPLNQRGELDFRIILKGEKIVRLKRKPYVPPLRKSSLQKETLSINYPAWEKKPWEKPFRQENDYEVLREEILRELEEVFLKENFLARTFGPPQNLPFQEQKPKKTKRKFASFKIISLPKNLLGKTLDLRKVTFPKAWQPVKHFAIAVLLIGLLVPAIAFIQKGLLTKDFVISSSSKAYQELKKAQENLGSFNLNQAQKNFQSAYQYFIEASSALDSLGGSLINIVDFLPFRSKISSGRNLLRAGKHLAKAGTLLSRGLNLLKSLSFEEILTAPKPGEVILRESRPIEYLRGFQQDLSLAKQEFKKAQRRLDRINLKTIPSPYQKNVASLQAQLPFLSQSLEEIDNYFNILLGILGGEDIRHYLIIFQNNSELRATGGFIGSYALITLHQGQVETLLVDDIYNIDGQLAVNVIPPYPIQKISSAWSTHDANWFFDFPTSAQTIAWFYEKTGGPTVDGVIALTPNVIEELLKLTGSIDLPSYNLRVDAENFRDELQYKIEKDYDKALGQPKQVLVDLAPRLLERIALLGEQKWEKLLMVLEKALARKDILLWFKKSPEEKLVQELGWGGEVAESPQDYLAIVHSNINGYKTDRVIREDISQKIEIKADGSVYNNLTIVRRHFGENASYEWYKKVNADYLRIYVPKGSRLISAQGNTKETVLPPLDYQKEGFIKDPLVSQIEKGMKKDPLTGLDIFEESGKAVFGGWLYVSPGEEVVFNLKYQLPFIVNPKTQNDAYSLMIQRQPGMSLQNFRLEITYPEEWRIHWAYPKESLFSQSPLRFKDELDSDKIFGAVFRQNP